MKQEYLLLDEQEKKEISEYKPEGVQAKLFSVENGKCWYVEYVCEGNNEATAKRLSEVDDYIRGHFQVTILQNDSSAYFNNRLYPLISDFERKLRKILYIFSAINKEDDASKNIEKLEEKDFGQIFTMLFVDDGFMNAAKDVVKNTQRVDFSKADIIRLLSGIEEKAVWDKLLGDDVVPTLRKQFQDVRNIRNDIMHSHDIGWGTFNKAQKLIRTINSEIETAINDVEVKENIAKKNPSFNKTLADALRIQDQFGPVVDAILPQMKHFDEMSKALSEYYRSNPEFERMSQIVSQLAAQTQPSPEMMGAFEQAQRLSQSIADSPGFRAAQESAQKIAEMYRNNPGLVEAQRQALQISQMLKDNPSLLAMQEHAFQMSQLVQSVSSGSENDADEEENKNGGSENGEDEDGIGRHDGTEHRED